MIKPPYLYAPYLHHAARKLSHMHRVVLRAELGQGARPVMAAAMQLVFTRDNSTRWCVITPPVLWQPYRDLIRKWGDMTPDHVVFGTVQHLHMYPNDYGRCTAFVLDSNNEGPVAQIDLNRLIRGSGRLPHRVWMRPRMNDNFKVPFSNPHIMTLGA